MGSSEQDSAIQPSKRCRPRFELKKPEEPDDSVLSSDLSIELSHHEDQIPYLSFQEDQENDYEEEDDDDELPSFLTQADNKPSSITDGAFVWHKFRNFPFWPALVKRVNRKLKKASIMFVDDSIIQGKKGFTVTLKTLKPFDCEEAKELVCQAKEKYGVAIELSMDLITDYRIRKACGSFSGSFIEYYAHDMSYPVRRKYPQAASEMLSIGSDAVMDDTFDDDKEDCSGEQLKKVSRSSKRLLPDRTHAAHNRANEKLVHFIVKQHMVDEHILAVIRGQQQSRWLRSFLSASHQKRVVDVYLEDEKQLDQVYQYLSNLYTTAEDNALSLVKLKSLEHVPFVLDVLLPEAIIYAIAGVDNVSIKKAEEKYLQGRRASRRERQEFDQMIDQHMRIKAQNTALAQLSEAVN
ncbi:PWWP domain-containing DNA repair factor 3A-like [Sphaeramia orbicularis]|uniref:PWWP domain-containing DNA repair factor 3A-like n=1 Tax=Sphaeramia orbicularis TaxID=375764 RepID=UPI00117F09F8|nr:PWWP domain-containing DNA repair factor 3A-like [Sphaeramia orbicularis]